MSGHGMKGWDEEEALPQEGGGTLGRGGWRRFGCSIRARLEQGVPVGRMWVTSSSFPTQSHDSQPNSMIPNISRGAVSSCNPIKVKGGAEASHHRDAATTNASSRSHPIPSSHSSSTSRRGVPGSNPASKTSPKPFPMQTPTTPIGPTLTSPRPQRIHGGAHPIAPRATPTARNALPEAENHQEKAMLGGAMNPEMHAEEKGGEGHPINEVPPSEHEAPASNPTSKPIFMVGRHGSKENVVGATSTVLEATASFSLPAAGTSAWNPG